MSMRSMTILVMLFLARLAIAGEAGWSVPFARWTEARTVDSCTEAIPPEGMPKVMRADHRMQLPLPTPPFGAWKEKDGAVQATGVANCWSTMLKPGETKNATITTRFTVQKSCAAARQLPGGCVRWGFHWGENLPGWDVGVVFGYQNPLNFYRLQLSAARGELALWDATGGFLQLIPCQVALGVPHTLVVRWFGAHCLAALDGKPVMDYWDRTLPYEKGQVGLTVWKSDVRFDQFTVNQEVFDRSPMPVHTPNFRFEPTKNILTEHPGFHMTPRDGLILFDGYEPICYFYKQEMDKGTELARGSLIQEAVKLKPGWRAAYFTYMGPPCNDGNCPVLQGELPEALKIDKAGATLVFHYTVLWKQALQTDYTCTVSFDTASGVYRYAYKGIAKAIAPCTFNEFEFYDPYVFNNREPGSEVVHTWNPAGHKWWVYQKLDGTWERRPLVDPLGHENANAKGWTAGWKINDYLYPDPGACPAFENELGWDAPPGRQYNLGQCTWGYDYHHRETGARLEMKTGDTRSFAFTLTALPPAAADALFAKSQLAKELADDKRVLLPFIPTGTKFDVTTTWQDPKYQLFWEGGGVLDTTVGHGDQRSLRIAAPAQAKVMMRQYILEAYAQRWWVRGWVRIQGTKDPGANLTISYPGQAKNVFSFGAADREWTYFSFITDVCKVRDETTLSINLPGGGTAWIDDFAISALKDGETPKVTGEAQ